MLWVVAVSVVVLNVAVFGVPPDKVPEPITVAPSLNVTDPVAPVVTVAMNVTKSPYPDGLRDDWTVVVDDVWPTLNVPEAELAPKFPCAGYLALNVWFPDDRIPTSNCATPGEYAPNAPISSAPPSTLK